MDIKDALKDVRDRAVNSVANGVANGATKEECLKLLTSKQDFLDEVKDFWATGNVTADSLLQLAAMAVDFAVHMEQPLKKAA